MGSVCGASLRVFPFPFPLQSMGTVLSSDIPSAAESEEDEDGMNDMNEEVMSLIWSEDLRVQEVRRLLQSARPVRVNVVQMPEASDHEYIEEKENRYGILEAWNGLSWVGLA